MADMSQVNLERLRVTDAMWEETKHPRADNGQFTSGSGGGGAKVTKATPGMAGGRFGALKNVSGALAGVNAGIKKAEQTFGNRLNLTRQMGEKKYQDLKQREAAVKGKYKNDWRYGNAYGRLKKAGHEGLAERVKNKAMSREEQRQAELAGLEKERGRITKEFDTLTGERQKANNRQYEGTMSKLWPQKQDLEARQKKFQAAGKTLTKARPGIAKMRQQAKAAQPAAKPQASTAEVHPMENDVKKDIQYWLQSHYRNPSDKQKADAVESIGEQYKSYLKTAEKNWKLAQSVPDLDEATRNSFKKKYDDATEKLKAFEGMWKHGRFWN